ncbi:MAG: pilus assembly protein PilM [Candidatus Komeilibacteria bacterium]|nr:pilus assembly protein PilM [Candidatus Komeilibacteria bacterium]
MGLFASKESYLGVDIGTASIKIVELSSLNGRPRLMTYGYADIVTDIVHSKSEENQIKIVNSLKNVVAKSRVGTNLAIAALPTFSVFNSIITLPAMSDKDLALAIKWEAKKYVPLPLEEMILDWKIIKENNGTVKSPLEPIKPLKKKGFPLFNFKKNGSAKASDKLPDSLAKPAVKGENVRVLVTAAPKNLVSRYMSIFRQAGLKLISLETEAFALSRSLIGSDPGTIMIVDIGSITTDICIIEKGVPVLNRSIDLGGLSISKAIAQSLNISLERAEQFKRDFGVSLSADNQPQGINKNIAASLSPIINEIKYVFDLYQGQASRPVEKIVLSGGSAFLPNLSGYFEDLFAKPTIIGNPWDKVVYDAGLKAVLDEVGSRMAVAIGLAMRDIK